MNIMTSTSNGFVIAEQDLAMRGPGDLYGTKQSGVLKFKIADLVEDVAILEETRNAAQHLLNEDPQLMKPEHQALRYHLSKTYSEEDLRKIS